MRAGSSAQTEIVGLYRLAARREQLQVPTQQDQAPLDQLRG
jgi:hypothetical protein